MGPGFNSQVENKLFGSRFSDVEFWDQPKIPSSEKAYDQLLKALSLKIKELSCSKGEKIKLYCHSFGGRLASSALEASSEFVEECIFISTGYYFENSFLNICKVLAKDNNTPKDLKDRMSQFVSQNLGIKTKEKFWESVNLCLEDPDFMRVYWADKDDYKKYLGLVSQVEKLDFDTFTNVSNDFISHGLGEPIQSLFSGRVKILLGEADSLIDCDKEVKAWKKVFPGASIQVLSGLGHFIHIEKDSLQF
jgi:pimeloyl-ACP methyl ester carboxylesterase